MMMMMMMMMDDDFFSGALEFDSFNVFSIPPLSELYQVDKMSSEHGLFFVDY